MGYRGKRPIHVINRKSITYIWITFLINFHYHSFCIISTKSVFNDDILFYLSIFIVYTKSLLAEQKFLWTSGDAFENVLQSKLYRFENLSKIRLSQEIMNIYIANLIYKSLKWSYTCNGTILILQSTDR